MKTETGHIPGSWEAFWSQAGGHLRPVGGSGAETEGKLLRPVGDSGAAEMPCHVAMDLRPMNGCIPIRHVF